MNDQKNMRTIYARLPESIKFLNGEVSFDVTNPAHSQFFENVYSAVKSSRENYFRTVTFNELPALVEFDRARSEMVPRTLNEPMLNMLHEKIIALEIAVAEMMRSSFEITPEQDRIWGAETQKRALENSDA